MLRAFLLLSFLFVLSCGSSEPGSSMEVGATYTLDIPAGEIFDYPVRPLDHCLGIKREEKFAEYDHECQAVVGLGECIEMPNPANGGAFYCALCGLKGTEMVCYMINPQ